MDYLKTPAQFATMYPMEFEYVDRHCYSTCPMFPGIAGNGETEEDAAYDLLWLLEDAIENRIKLGIPLPRIDPEQERRYAENKLPKAEKSGEPSGEGDTE